MPIFDFEDSGASGRGTKKPLKLFLGTGVLVGALALGSTFAANINLNGDSNVEFGQGVTQTVACSGSQSLTVTPLSTFVNSSGTGESKFSGIRVDNIPTTCQDRDFIFSAYNDEAASTALAIFNTSGTQAVVYMKSDNTFEVGMGGTGLSVMTNSASTFTLTFTAPVTSADDVYKVTIESTAHTVVTEPVGVTWTERTTSGIRTWFSIASSSDGSKLAAVDAYGYIYTSADSGATWTERTTSGQRGWFSIASSSDGSKLAAVNNGSSFLSGGLIIIRFRCYLDRANNLRQ